MVDGPTAYLANGNRILTVDVSDPAIPTPLGSLNISKGSGYTMYKDGFRLYLAAYNGGLKVINIFQPENPTMLGEFDESGVYYGIAVTDDYAYAVGSGFQVVDISDPALLTPEWFTGEFNSYSLLIEEDLAYLCNYWMGLYIYDLSVPDSPVLRTIYDTPSNAQNVFIKDDLAYIADRSSLQIIDVSDVDNPVFVGSFSDNCSPMGVHVVGDYAYLADYGFGGLLVLDVSNPAAPVYVGEYDLPGRMMYAVRVSGEYAYLADRNNGLYVFDVTDPTAPEIVSSLIGINNLWNLDIRGDYLLLSSMEGVWLVNVSNPADPLIVAVYKTPDTQWNEAVFHDDLVYATGNTGQVAALRVNWPAVAAGVYFNAEQTGTVNPDSASQIAPASYLTFRFDRYTFPHASPGNPVVVQVDLPADAPLSQTLATGTVDTTAPAPAAGELVADLAVTEYAVNPKTGRAEPLIGGKTLDDIDSRAVQLLRYVAGETSILLRLNQSTLHWDTGSADTFYGFTIGLGGGVWPDTAESNWGAAGRFAQDSTLFYLDLRNCDFAQHNDTLAVTLSSFYQYTGADTGVTVSPDQVTLFTLESLSDDPPAARTRCSIHPTRPRATGARCSTSRC